MLIEMNLSYPDAIASDLRIFTGPRYNTFGPAPDRREEPGRFFQRSAWKTIDKRSILEDGTEEWDGLE